MPDYLFSCESAGVRSKNVLTRKANPNGMPISWKENCMKAIYKITNNKNNKMYIGQSSNPMYRWKQHQYIAMTKKDIGESAIHDALREVGLENFSFEILGWFENYNQKEKEFIQYYNSMIPNGYNIQEGGNEPPHKYGENHHNSTYSQQIVDNIIDDLLSKKYTQKEIEKKYHVTQQLITSINRGVTHRRPGLKYPIIKTSNYHCDKKTIEKIVFLLKESTCTCAEIGQFFGFSSSTIKAINSGRKHHFDNLKYPIRNFRGKANSQSVEAILAKRSTETIDTSLEM